MSQEIEIEYKNLLTKKEFDLLQKCFPFPNQSQTQINYYFETNDFLLKENQRALRIREKNGTYRLTLKEPYSNGLLETHDVLTEQEAMSWIRGNIIKKEHTARQLEDLNISPESLIYYGNLTTQRRETYFNTVLLVLDHSMYNGHLDYEFELETTDEAVGLEIFNSILAEHTIPKRNTPNKIQRFFSTLSQ